MNFCPKCGKLLPGMMARFPDGYAAACARCGWHARPRCDAYLRVYDRRRRSRRWRRGRLFHVSELVG